MIAGLRYTHQRITDYTTANSYDNTTTPTYGEVAESNVSGRLGVQYRISPALSAYATAVRGYKGPQVTPAGSGLQSTVIAPEIPTAFEVGLKGAVLDNSVAVDFNVFSSRVHDYQGQRCAIAPIGALVCFGESVPAVTTKGMELDVFGRPVRGLTLNGGLIYDVAEYPNGWTGYNPNDLTPPNLDANGLPVLGPGTTDLSGRQLVGVPKTKFTFSGEYTFPFGSIEAVIAADSVFKSAMRLGPTADPRFVYPAHWTTGARLGLQSRESIWSVSLFVRNISNEHEPITLFGGPSFTMPGMDPANLNGYVNGVSGWISPDSLRQVGLSVEFQQ